MAFEFEALVGHLYVVGGRSINTTPPGALCEVAPKKAARGREADTFFVMVLPSGDSIAPTAFYERMALLAAERYFESTGSVTAGLRHVFNSMNQDLFEHNRTGNRNYETAIIAAVLKSSDLIVGRVGSGTAITLYKGEMLSFPDDLSDDEALYTAPMGVHPIPVVKMKQFAVEAGTRVLFSDANLAELNREQIENALKSSDIGTVLVALKALARLQISLMAVEFIPPDAPLSEALPEGQSTVAIAEKARAEAAKTRQTSTSENVLITGADGPAPRPPRQTKSATKEVQRRAQRGIGKAAVQVADSLSLTGRVVDHFFGEGGKTEAENATADAATDPKTAAVPQVKRAPWAAFSLGAGAVVLLPVIIVALVVVLWLSRTGQSEYEICLEEAQSRAEVARSVVNNERQTVLNAWEVTLAQVGECEALRPSDPMMTQLRAEGRNVIDQLNLITRREASVVESFPEAQLTRIVAQELNVYTLDAANGFVYNISLADDGLTLTRPGTPIIRTGSTVGGVPVGNIIDIAFNKNNNVLVAVDRQGVVVECSPRFNQCETQRLLGVENWINPVAVTVWSGRIYVLDTGVGDGQIWRYERAGGTYRDPPSEVFSGIRPVIRSAVDLEIDGLGNIFVLSAEGIIQKFLSGQPQQFGFAAFPPGQELTSAVSMYLDDSVTSQSIYIVNQPRRTIYETSLIGTFGASYRVFNEDQFDLLTAIVVVPGRAGREIIYAASGNTIFAIQKDR